MTSRPTLQARRARVYGSLRTAHLERAAQLRPAAIVYSSKRYDFDPAAADGLEIVHADGGEAAALIARSGLDAVELNEPLMLGSLPTTLRVIAALRRRGSRRPIVVSYLIGNENPFTAASAPRWRTKVRRRLERAAAGWVWRRIDRAVYGTLAAQQTYEAVLGASGARTALIPALPAPCDRDDEPAKVANRVIFLGALVARKGFRQLLAAWPLVAAAVPDARLVIAGKGELADAARALTAGDPSTSFVEDPPRATIHRLLAEAQVLVLPSQPSATWREQVGLPIVEGLAHGCSIVTTSETGLASWLAENGHSVIDPPDDVTCLAAAIVAQLRAARSADSVLAALPSRDGRLAADDWLFAGVSDG